MTMTTMDMGPAPARRRDGVTLTSDHRAVDGAAAAGFPAALKSRLEGAATEVRRAPTPGR